jgi:hypothetical protein
MLRGKPGPRFYSHLVYYVPSKLKHVNHQRTGRRYLGRATCLIRPSSYNAVLAFERRAGSRAAGHSTREVPLMRGPEYPRERFGTYFVKQISEHSMRETSQ